MVLLSDTLTAPGVYPTYPPSSLLKFRPDSDPQALSPPVSDRSLAYPFNIDPELYNNALHFSVPISIALIYATTVTYVNRVNKDRNYKPWAFSKSLTFYILVVSHNVSLAVYSAWTFVGMVNAIRRSWPGWEGEYGLAGAADALCKINGPRGLGSAATYNVGLGEWSNADKAVKMAGGRPDSTDVGRIWNEGLAFYGWLFYLSKFYEVMDTAIILCKGKRSGTLQTYHHTGAMLCLWAGIRYMSPPIWMFVLINSGLHALMYTYYTLSALTIPVPKAMKQILTTLQIAQIVFGCSYALAHLFVAYDIPVEIPYLYIHNLSTALPSAASTMASSVSSAFSSATATAGIGSWLKKAALRAAGEEGLAENVRNNQGDTFGIDAIHAADVEKAQEEIRYRTGTQRVHCLDTSGEVFAILLNAIYLVPLFALFVRYFYKSYIARAHAEPPKPTQQENIKKSSQDAIKDVEREIKEAMTHEQGGATEPPPELKAKLEKAKSDAKHEASIVSDKAHDLGEKAKKGAGDLGDKVKDATGDLPEKVQKGAQDLSDQAKDVAGDLPEKVQKGAKDGIDKAKDIGGDLPAKASEAGQQIKKSAKDVKQNVQDDLQALQEKMKIGGERPKSKGKENSKPNGETKNRDKSPEKASKPRDQSTGKKAPTPREKSPVKKAPTPREKSPEKKAPAPRDPSPQKGSSDSTESPHKEETDEDKKNDSPALDASAYEIVPDEPKTEEERKAEEEMQPKQE